MLKKHYTIYSMDYLLTKHFTVCFICWQSIIQYSMYYFACRDFPRLSVIGQPCSDILYSRIRNKNLKMKKWKFLYTLAQFYISKTTHAKVYCIIVWTRITNSLVPASLFSTSIDLKLFKSYIKIFGTQRSWKYKQLVRFCTIRSETFTNLFVYAFFIIWNLDVWSP